MPTKVEELLGKYSREQLKSALEKTVTTVHDVADNTATRATVTSGYVPAKEKPIPDRGGARLDDGPLGFVPVVGDILQGAQVVQDISDALSSNDKSERNMKYASAALGAGMLFLPNTVEKFGKPFVKQLLKNGEERLLLKQPARTIGLRDALARPYAGQNFIHHGVNKEYVEDVLNGETRAMSPSLAVNRWGDYNGKYNPGFYGDGYIFLGDKSLLDNSMLFRGDADTPTVSSVISGLNSVPSDLREEIAEDIWRQTQFESVGSPLIIQPEDLDKLDIPSSDYYFEAKYHGILPYERFRHGIFPEPSSAKDEAVIRAFEDRGLPVTTYKNVGGMEGYYNRANTLLQTLNENQDLLFKSGGGIHIKPSHRGRLTELKKRTGKTEAELYNDGNPAHKKMVVFARNARKWKHENGGLLDRLDSAYGGDREKILEAVRSVLKNEYGLGGNKDDDPAYIGPPIPEVLRIRRDAVDDAVERVKAVENSKDNPKGGWDAERQVWVPHDSPEGGAQTIGYGIKLSNGTPEAALAAEQGYLTDEQVDALTYSSVRRYHNNARKVYDKKYGEGEWDKLSAKQQSLLTDYEYNPGLRKFPSFMKAVRENDKDGMLREYKRYLGKLELTGRNNRIKSEIEEMFSGQ